LAQKIDNLSLIRDEAILQDSSQGVNGQKLLTPRRRASRFEGLGLTANQAAAGFDIAAHLDIQKLQVGQLVRALPLLVLFHASAALCIHNLTTFTTAFDFAAFWFGAVLVTATAMVMVFVLWLNERFKARPDWLLRGVEVLCLALGLVWAVPVAVAVQIQDQANVYTIATITLATLGVAVAALARAPTGAVIFVAVVAAALARSLYLTLDGVNFAAALAIAIYALVLIAFVINSHLQFSQRARSELEQKQQNDTLELLLTDFEREARDWLWQTDEQGRLVYFSPRFAEALNMKTEDLFLRPLRHVLADYARGEDWRKLDFTMADEAVVPNLQLAMQIDGKALAWQFSASVLRDGRGRFSGYRGVVRDVTVTEDAERRVELAMQATENTGAAKSQFLAVMSHELRTPINAILGFAELLVNEKSENLQQKTRLEFADTILTNCKQLQYLVNDIIDATRMERGALQLVEQDVDAAELVEVAIRQCRELAERGQISIVGRLTDGVSVKGDAQRLRQVMVNLLSNAIKFSPSNSIINVEMQKGRDGQFVLAIKDAGIGVSNLDIERVFEPFVQADDGMARRFNGAGLGLPIARRIARLHGGDVILQSEVGAGTIASLVLPKSRIAWPEAVRNSDTLVTFSDVA
jgi:signal transduction histidine kinase